MSSHLGEVVVTQPTIGSNVEEINYKNVKFQVWDLGGQVHPPCLLKACGCTGQLTCCAMRAVGETETFVEHLLL